MTAESPPNNRREAILALACVALDRRRTRRRRARAVVAIGALSITLGCAAWFATASAYTTRPTPIAQAPIATAPMIEFRHAHRAPAPEADNPIPEKPVIAQADSGSSANPIPPAITTGAAPTPSVPSTVRFHVITTHAANLDRYAPRGGKAGRITINILDDDQFLRALAHAGHSGAALARFNDGVRIVGISLPELPFLRDNDPTLDPARSGS